MKTPVEEALQLQRLLPDGWLACVDPPATFGMTVKEGKRNVRFWGGKCLCRQLVDIT